MICIGMDVSSKEFIIHAIDPRQHFSFHLAAWRGSDLMKKKILVADDEAGLLATTLLRLNKMGYDAFEGVNGEEALDLARQRMPDLILLDKLMPKLNGDAVLKILKKDEMLKHIPVILISAAAEDLEERARESGAAGFLFKPCETRELLDMIEKYIG